MEQMSNITKAIEIEELVRKYPTTVRFLSERGVKCIACGEPVWGTLEEAAREKGFSDDQIESLVSELNRFIARSTS
ncbi:MAG: hypothetical protein Kow00127_00890 [Bacteroidales bacterium]